jgi:hypothetical protein
MFSWAAPKKGMKSGKCSYGHLAVSIQNVHQITKNTMREYKIGVFL